MQIDGVVSVVSQARSATDERAAGYAGLLSRLHQAGESAPRADEGTVAASLGELYRRGLLALSAEGERTGPWQVAYVASRDARRRVFDGAGQGWPEKVHKRQRETFRRTPGALLQFVLEREEGAEDRLPAGPHRDTGEASPIEGGRASPARLPAVEVFITDWSPSPAACAVAVHPDHLLARDVPAGAGPAFLGRYCRHPITGDLLPLWSADWVKPEFGTGAVLVNPAHDAVDLEFGRSVGLPVRFCLVPHSFDDTPATWPQPPVIKTGRSIKTGPFDGLPFADAQEAYFEHMRKHGLAERHEDVSAERHVIARLVPDAEGAARWDPALSRPLFGDGLDASGAADALMRIEAMPVLAAALVDGERPVVVSPSSERTGALLCYRLLRADLSGDAPDVGGLQLVGAVQGGGEGTDPGLLALAALVGAQPEDVVTVRDQMLEQVERYLTRHAELLMAAQRSVSGADDDGGIERTASQVKKGIERQDLKQSFTTLYRLQKQLTDQHMESPRASGAYFSVSHMMLGVETPEAVDVAATWERL